jgi:hypothetical protein
MRGLLVVEGMINTSGISDEKKILLAAILMATHRGERRWLFFTAAYDSLF